MADKEEAGIGSALAAVAVLGVIGAALWFGITDHWQWAVIIPIGSAFAAGLVKFGWDAVSAVEKSKH